MDIRTLLLWGSRPYCLPATENAIINPYHLLPVCRIQNTCKSCDESTNQPIIDGPRNATPTSNGTSIEHHILKPEQAKVCVSLLLCPWSLHAILPSRVLGF
jgi:hypothetical protein